MPDDKTIPIATPPVTMTVIGTGDGLVQGAKALTPPDQPNIIISVISPALAIVVRFANLFLTTLVDDTELALSQAGAISSGAHARLNPKILALLKAGKAANTAIATWPPGQPAPKELRAAVEQLGLVAHAVITSCRTAPPKPSSRPRC